MTIESVPHPQAINMLIFIHLSVTCTQFLTPSNCQDNQGMSAILNLEQFRSRHEKTTLLNKDGISMASLVRKPSISKMYPVDIKKINVMANLKKVKSNLTHNQVRFGSQFTNLTFNTWCTLQLFHQSIAYQQGCNLPIMLIQGVPKSVKLGIYKSFDGLCVKDVPGGMSHFLP